MAIYKISECPAIYGMVLSEAEGWVLGRPSTMLKIPKEYDSGRPIYYLYLGL